MPWVRLDEEFARHPKVAAAGPLGLAMQVAGLCYCNQYLTDGFVPRRVAASLLNFEGIAMNVWKNEMIGGGDDATWELVVGDLVDCGLWEIVEGGYRIHDYHEYQPTKADVLAERKQKSEAGRLGGLNSAITRRARSSRNEAPAKAPAVAPAQAEPQAESKPVPVPVTEEEQEQQQNSKENLAVDVARENLNGSGSAAADELLAPTDSDVEQAVNAIPGHDAGTFRQVLPLARQLTAPDFRAVLLKHADRVYAGRGTVRNQPGLLVQLLQAAVDTRRRQAADAYAVAFANRTLEDDVRAYATMYGRSIPWDAALELLEMKLAKHPDEDHDALLETAREAFDAVAADLPAKEHA